LTCPISFFQRSAVSKYSFLSIFCSALIPTLLAAKREVVDFANGNPSPDELSSNCSFHHNVQVWASSRPRCQVRLVGPEAPIDGPARELLGRFDVTRYHILPLWLRREKGSDGL